MINLDFKKFLAESLEQYVLGNTITLYHFSKQDASSIEIQPNQFGKNSYSLRELKTSKFPRSFFYINLDHKEDYFKNDTPLYSVKFPANKIYNLANDPLNLINWTINSNNGVLNYDMLFEKIVSEGFQGAYYGASMETVVLFVPVTAYRINTQAAVA